MTKKKKKKLEYVRLIYASSPKVLASNASNISTFLKRHIH